MVKCMQAISHLPFHLISLISFELKNGDRSAMADLLVRGIPEETKKLLAVRAAENGRSQSAEVVAMLEKELRSSKKSWVTMLYDVAQEVNGVELELPARHPAREFLFED